MELKVIKVKTLKFIAKCSDCFTGNFYDENNHHVREINGYVPWDFGIGGGDYVELDIDLTTGQILNWKPILEIKTKEES